MHPFLEQYNKVAVPKLKESHSYQSAFTIPKVEKVVVNIGTGSSVQQNGKSEESIAELISTITGQKPMVTQAGKAISGFKVRRGMNVGLKATLRGTRMYDFLSKLTQIALPRTRDFRGLKPSSISEDGNLHIGIKDSMIFPEVSQDTAGHSLQVTLVSTAKNREEARLLFESLGFIFQEK